MLKGVLSIILWREFPTSLQWVGIVLAVGSILTGFSVGIPNLFSSYFLILALDSLKTSVVFPIYSAGSIVLITFGSFIIFKEKINNKNKMAIILTIIALIMINL